MIYKTSKARLRDIESVSDTIINGAVVHSGGSIRNMPDLTAASIQRQSTIETMESFTDKKD